MNRWSQDTESLLIFNPREEAVRDSAGGFPTLLLSHSQATKPLLAESARLHQENQYLKEQLRDQQDLIQIQKAMLSEFLRSLTQQTVEMHN